MRIVFMGTPEFAVPTLRALAAAHEVVLVVSRPDAVRSRGKVAEPSAVATVAAELGLPVEKTSRITPDLLSRMRELAPDVSCVAAYGCLLPDEAIDVARLGCVNVHASLLPRWRGAAPIQRAILAGDVQVGVSIMRIVSAMDAGAYCRQASLPVGETPCTELTSRLAELGARELLEALGDMETNSDEWTEQDESLVTFAAKVEKRELWLDPADPAALNSRRVQASLDTAPARLSLAGSGVRVLAARVATDGPALAPGELSCPDGRLLLGCTPGTLELLVVKPDGKRAMEAAAYLAGHRATQTTWARL